jgi:hypothetical protein
MRKMSFGGRVPSRVVNNQSTQLGALELSCLELIDQINFSVELIGVELIVDNSGPEWA